MAMSKGDVQYAHAERGGLVMPRFTGPFSPVAPRGQGLGSVVVPSL